MVQIKKENKTEKSQGRGVAGEMAEQLRVHRVVPGSDSQHPHDASHCLELPFPGGPVFSSGFWGHQAYTWCPVIYGAKAPIYMKE